MENLQNIFMPDFRINWKLFIPDLDYLRTASLIDVIDILIVAYIVYRVIKLLRGTSAERLVKGVLVLAFILFLATSLHLMTIAYILRIAFTYGGFVLVVIFQPELRRILEQMGKGNVSRLFVGVSDPDAIEAAIKATVSACADMSKDRTGALIVFERAEKLGEIVGTGTMVDAVPTAELIKNVFFKNSPLHDGAMIVRDGRVYAAGCVLPLSGSQNLSRDLGTRHRAAVGMSESADSVLVVVSEETGAISVALGGMLKRHLSPETLQKVLETELLKDPVVDKSRVAALRNLWKGGQDK